MKSNAMVYFGFLVVLLTGFIACKKYPFHYRTDLFDSLSVQRQHLYTYSRHGLFKKLVPQSIKVIKVTPKYINPYLDDIPLKEYRGCWGSRFAVLKTFEILEYTKNDTIQEGYYIAKERNEIYHYWVDHSISPLTLNLEKIPYDVQHEAVQIVHQKKYKLFKKDYKYLVTKACKSKQGNWSIKAFCYYKGQMYN